jgi:hypothetical protein
VSARDAAQAAPPASGTATRVTGAISRFFASSKENEGRDFAVRVGTGADQRATRYDDVPATRLDLPMNVRLTTMLLALAAASCGGAVAAQSATVDAGPDGDGAGGGASGEDAASSSSGGSSGSSGGGSNGGSSSGGSSGGGSEMDASGDSSGVTPPVWDAALADGSVTDATFDVSPSPAGLAGFAFVVDGEVQTPLGCAAADWEFPPVAGQTDCSKEPPCPGIESAYVVNTGTLPMAYVAQSYWNPGVSTPGVPTGDPFQLAGVLAPGEQVDITSVYVGGITAILGSAEPFSDPDGGKPVGDEGIIPWPLGVAGGGGATQMYVAEIEQYPSCEAVFHAW